jgi:hypothetical protein
MRIRKKLNQQDHQKHFKLFFPSSKNPVNNTGFFKYLVLYSYLKKEPPEINREGPNQKPLTIKPYPMKIHQQYR